MTDTVSHHNIPTTLNGYAVKAFSIADDGARALVIVYRDDEGGFLPWVTATWWPELGDCWMWGNYHASWEQAAHYDAMWRRTYCAGPLAAGARAT